jgi:hypothetical protein
MACRLQLVYFPSRLTHSGGGRARSRCSSPPQQVAVRPAGCSRRSSQAPAGAGLQPTVLLSGVRLWQWPASGSYVVPLTASRCHLLFLWLEILGTNLCSWDVLPTIWFFLINLTSRVVSIGLFAANLDRAEFSVHRTPRLLFSQMTDRSSYFPNRIYWNPEQPNRSVRCNRMPTLTSDVVGTSQEMNLLSCYCILFNISIKHGCSDLHIIAIVLIILSLPYYGHMPDGIPQNKQWPFY